MSKIINRVDFGISFVPIKMKKSKDGTKCIYTKVQLLEVSLKAPLDNSVIWYGGKQNEN